MERETVKISALKAAPYNPRRISKEASEGLAKSLERWGVVQEVVANRRTGHIVGGHQRVAALKKMGVKEVPVVWVDLDDVEEKALNVALNNPHISGEFDDTIAGLLAEIRDGIGPHDFAELKLDDLLPPDATVVEGNTDPDDVPEAPEEPITKPGDLWILGDHRLLCGDSTNIQHVERLMGGKKADMVFTDPPYAIYGSSTGVGDDIADTKMIQPFFREIFNNMATALKGHFYVCCDWRTYPILNDLLHGSGFAVKNMIVWDKVHMGMGMFYRNTHELIICGYPRFDKVKMRGKETFGAVSDSNVWSIQRETQKQHGAQKPVDLAKRAINNSISNGELVLDLFGGSGSTLIACEDTNRKCRMMEMEPKYCDVTVKRWEDFTGKKAVLEANDATG